MTPIRLDTLRKQFGETVAVDDVSIDIPAGDLFFLLGPSGCGKTTLLRMIAGFQEPTAGRILFGGDDVTHVAPQKRDTGMVFQGYALWPHMTVRQNVAFGLEVRKVSKAETRKRVDAALERVQLGHQADRKTNQLSGGQQQRVALARALVIEPRVLLLDEPLSNLDAKLRLEMRQGIRDITKAAGTTGVYVTHDQKEALSMADRVAVLNGGKLEQVGPPRELYERPKNRFVAGFLGETNLVAAEVVGRDGGRVLLQTAAGRLASAVFPERLPASGSVTCSIRPEAVVLAEPGSDAEKRLPGENRLRLKRAGGVYLGEVAQHTVRATAGGDDGGGGGLTLTALEMNPRFVVDAEAAPLTGWVDPADVVVLRD
ncbi:ABC transporter ATP-binding protein [Phycisphaera mikurensis]|uniref:Putative ABC transporter ATP-binding protein n=1 Tax=Phycisphaera mikurensis (strain NBRC 102666 / KCTC 22515 / FYK2301M01) TaxID=1142394 RepID=I0IGR4_PHYMF|nr:ABC transporter ATP-binding protein [Phycisphaera mikurensis]MBB6443241.1 iron(III) transport system ATP-binding protein [Phycisphaera mikurensis]BAM04452.1 putative ABC transporter ATP-binding protein [Phycisphaera mikurensis NBRC 102666]